MLVSTAAFVHSFELGALEARRANVEVRRGSILGKIALRGCTTFEIRGTVGGGGVCGLLTVLPAQHIAYTHTHIYMYTYVCLCV